MDHATLYRALIEAGTGEELAKEAAESVVYAREAATRTDLAECRAGLEGNVAALDAKVDLFRVELKGDITALNAKVDRFRAEVERKIERSLHGMAWRIIGYFLTLHALFFAFDKLVLAG